MKLDERLEEAYEAFQGTVRKLDEVISQLELWSDECTANHKKEEVRLVQYVEMHFNLEEVKADLQEQMTALSEEQPLKEAVEEARTHVASQLARYEETERIIHEWVREIKDLPVMINRSGILMRNKAYIDAIVAQNA